MAIQVGVVEHRHAHHTANELEVFQVLRVDFRQGVGLVGHPLGRGDEQGIVGVKYLLRQHQEPLTRQTTSIHPLFPLEHNPEPSLEFLRLAVLEVEERVLEDVGATDLNTAAVPIALALLDLAELLTEPQTLVFEVHIPGVLHESCQGGTQQRDVAGDEGVQEAPVLLDELHTDRVLLFLLLLLLCLVCFRLLLRPCLLTRGGCVVGGWFTGSSLLFAIHFSCRCCCIWLHGGWQVPVDGMKDEKRFHQGQDNRRERQCCGGLGVLQLLQLVTHLVKVLVDYDPQRVKG
mmetsp:Transcript_54743/g.97413  ORF Transcript_54743/g.97413 Transcript_54743/m.97413 type:complete len:289 (+) Transcript_54743:1605-2471(+)